MWEIFYNRSANRYEACKKGFSWIGFFFPIITLFNPVTRKQGAAYIGLIIGLTIIYVVASTSGGDTTLAAILVFANLVAPIAFGATVNKYSAKDLMKRGYSSVGFVPAKTRKEALAMIRVNPDLIGQTKIDPAAVPI